jgi:hypothetical protein
MTFFFFTYFKTVRTVHLFELYVKIKFAFVNCIVVLIPINKPMPKELDSFQHQSALFSLTLVYIVFMLYRMTSYKYFMLTNNVQRKS